MSDFALDDLDRTRLDWPEPLLIDLISEHYGTVPNISDRMIAARLHVNFLRELVDGEARHSAFLRLELIACCAARGIAVQAIDVADDAAFREIRNVVEGRFRNSPRTRAHFMRRLDDAVGRLPARAEPRKETAAVQVFPMPRPALARVPPLRVVRRLSVSV